MFFQITGEDVICIGIEDNKITGQQDARSECDLWRDWRSYNNSICADGSKVELTKHLK